MSKNNPYGLVVNVENAKCIVEFDVYSEGDINYETWEVFYNKNFKGDFKESFPPDSWVKVNDLISEKTWESIDDQIKAQWKDVEDQQRAYDDYH